MERRPWAADGVVMLRAACLILMALLVLLATNVDADALAELVAEKGRARLLEGNRVGFIDDNTEAFERRLELIAQAEHHILLSTFLWRRDETGTKMLEAVEARLARSAEAGEKLEVRVILDAMSEGLAGDHLHTVLWRLRLAGAEVRFYNELKWALSPGFAARLHDKILIVDGARAIFGGRNLSDDYFLNTGRTWYDADVALEGPGVAELQMHFLKSWVALGYLHHPRRILHPPEWSLNEIATLWRTGRFTNGDRPLEAFATREWFPESTTAGPHRVAVLYDNPQVWRRAPSTDLLDGLIDGAQAEIDILSPFPNLADSTHAAVAAAVSRGVHVRFLVNDESGMMRVGKYWRGLLPSMIRLIEDGVELWGWQGAATTVAPEKLEACRPQSIPPLSVHAKLVQIDRRIAMVHASNFNLRSTYFNTEAGVLVEDAALAETIRGRIDALASEEPDEIHCADGSAIALGARAKPITESRIPGLRAQLDADGLGLYKLNPAY